MKYTTLRQLNLKEGEVVLHKGFGDGEREWVVFNDEGYLAVTRSNIVFQVNLGNMDVWRRKDKTPVNLEDYV